MIPLKHLTYVVGSDLEKSTIGSVFKGPCGIYQNKRSVANIEESGPPWQLGGPLWFLYWASPCSFKRVETTNRVSPLFTFLVFYNLWSGATILHSPIFTPDFFSYVGLTFRIWNFQSHHFLNKRHNGRGDNERRPHQGRALYKRLHRWTRKFIESDKL